MSYETSWPLAICLLVLGLEMAATSPSCAAGDLPVEPRGCTSPPNEECSGAIVLTTADLPFVVSAPLGCTNDVIDKPYLDVFYRYDCTQTGHHVFHMCGSPGDTYLRIYRDGCGWGDGVELATADDECPGSPPHADPLLGIELQAGESYWIELGTWRPDPPWAPPPGSPHLFSLELVGQPSSLSCDGTGLSTALIGEPGNLADTNGLGSVDRLFRLGKHEVSNRQYADYLNHTAEDDPVGAYNEDMSDSDRGGILRGGVAGSYAYWVKESFGDKPVNFLSWQDAARYANWLHNGQPSGAQGPTTTEAGAYDLSLPADQISRLTGARFFVPDHDEWYKGAYFDPVNPGADAGGTPDYWLYPTSADAVPVKALADTVGNVANPGTNVANSDKGADWNGENGNVTTVGGSTSESPWGLFDMGGNVLEVTETLDTPIPPGIPTRTARGGDFNSSSILMSSPAGFGLALNMSSEAANVGFRVGATFCGGDFDGDNALDGVDRSTFEACFTGSGGGPLSALCASGDFDGDLDVDCLDWDQFVLDWTVLGGPPVPIGPCDTGSIFSDGFETGDTSAWTTTVS